MIASPTTTQIERGGYSAIVYKEGDWIRAEDNKGTVISENTSASTVLQAALDAISAAGGGRLLQQEGSYTWAAAVTYSASNLEWEGSGHVINDCSSLATYTGAFKIEGAITGTNSALTAEGTKGQKDVTVADASSFTAGDWIRIRSETLFNSSALHLGELQMIKSIAGNVITCEDVLAFTYTVADTATIDLLTMYENITLRNMTFIGNYGVTDWKGFLFRELYNLLIEDIRWTKSQCYPILFYDIVGFEMRGCLVQDSDQAGTGYGVAIANASRDILIHHNRFYNCRHGIMCGSNNTYGVQTNQVYDSNTFRYSANHMAAMGPHNTYDGLVISNNTVMNDGLTYVAGLNTTIVGNNIYNDACTLGGIRVETISKYTNISGNTITCLNHKGISLDESEAATLSDVIISSNIIRVLGGGHAGISAKDALYTNIQISDNVIYSLDYLGIYFQDIDASSRLTIDHNIIKSDNQSGLMIDCDALVEYISITNNIVTPAAGADGIAVWGAAGSVAKYIQIHNNKVIGGLKGLRLRSSEYFSIHDNELIGSTTGIFFETVKPVDHYSIKNNHFINCTTPINDPVQGTRVVYDQHSDLFMDVIVASANAVHAAIVGTGAEQEITTAITNPDVPRNASITNSANSTGDVIITGVNAKGNSVTDTITIVTGGIAYGVVAFASVSKITIPSTVANPDTITVGISDKLGLSNIIYASGDVYKVKVNNADDPTIGTVNTTYHTVDCATINAADDITIWYKSNLNMIS